MTARHADEYIPASRADVVAFSISLAARPRIAIVGARKATAEGRRRAAQLARDCARAGIVVVSGLAEDPFQPRGDHRSARGHARSARVAGRYVPWQGIVMIERTDVEQAIVDDESMLEQVAGLLESGSGLAGWPEDARLALALALDVGAVSGAETWKAVTLRRHLFGPAGVVPEQIASIPDPSAAARRRAEGLRTGLPARVRYRVATYMLPVAD